MRVTPHIIDSDGDGIVDSRDKCPYYANPDQKYENKDSYGFYYL